MQGDCLSAVMFIFYLAECFNEESELNLPLNTDIHRENSFNINPFYADDTTFAGTNSLGKERLDNIEINTPLQLKKYNLTSNESKKEKYEVPRPPPLEPPPPKHEELISHKEDHILWSEFDYLVNYHPTIINDNPDWTKCKLLGSLLGTEEDINRRKSLVLNNVKNLNNIFKS